VSTHFQGFKLNRHEQSVNIPKEAHLILKRLLDVTRRNGHMRCHMYITFFTGDSMLVQQHDETRKYGCESAPNRMGKKEGVTSQFHFVALLAEARIWRAKEFHARGVTR
jgi:hypothetical protein